MSCYVVRLDGNKSAYNVTEALKKAQLYCSPTLERDVDLIEGVRTALADEQLITVQAEKRVGRRLPERRGAQIIHQWTPTVTYRKDE
jgi:hypothetical protein